MTRPQAAIFISVGTLTKSFSSIQQNISIVFVGITELGYRNTHEIMQPQSTFSAFCSWIFLCIENGLKPHHLKCVTAALKRELVISYVDLKQNPKPRVMGRSQMTGSALSRLL